VSQISPVCSPSSLWGRYHSSLLTGALCEQFNVEVDETDITREDVRSWKFCDAISDRPPPMIIETFIDTQELTNNQSLVAIDEDGRRWDVEEALDVSPSSSTGGNGQRARPEVILERWVVQLGEPQSELPRDLTPILPRTYKNSIVLFRSLYASARLLPAWKFGKKLFNLRSSVTSPKLRYRISKDPKIDQISRIDHLSVPIGKGHEDVLEKYVFDPIDSPAGPLSIHVTYRSHCDFRIDDSEAFLSSRFMGMDEQYCEPSLGRRQEGRPPSRPHNTRTTEVGSLPQAREERPGMMHPDQGQAYGSMSTFHQVGPPTGTSPLSALRAARVAGSESPEDMMPKKIPPNTRSAQGSRSSLRSADGPPSAGRRPSVSFMPFKTPSLSASPSQVEQMGASIPRGSLGKSSPLAVLAEARTPQSAGTHAAVVSRGSPAAAEQGQPSLLSGSPRPPAPPKRYSSAFGHRKAAHSTGGSSRTDDDNSSGKASIASSGAQPGSGVLAEGTTSSGSGSIQTDDDNISDFLKMLDQKKDLKSFSGGSDSAASQASTRRTSAALTKFQRMRDSNAALSESMSSSLMLHRSSSSTSRQLSSVPPMVTGTSISTSSSPGKPVSPHTPHTPAIPSRLSANSIIDYNSRDPSDLETREARSIATQGARSPRGARDPSTGAIDIPNSPRLFHPGYRRSSSAAQGSRVNQLGEDELYPYGTRSASLGVEDRPPVNIDALTGLHGDGTQDESAVADPSVETRRSAFGLLFNPNELSSVPMARQRSSESHEGTSAPTPGMLYRPHIGRRVSKGDTPPQGSSSSLVERGSGSGSSDRRGGRHSFSRPASTFEEEEPLLFDMSDFSATQQSGRSLEGLRGGLQSDRGGDRGDSDSGASSRRGNRRGGY